MKLLLNSQEGIIVSNRLVAAMEAGIQKEAAILALAEFKKNDLLMRNRLFILQVQKQYGEEVADKLSRTKAGEFLDPNLNKIFEEENKMKRRLQLELEKERERSRITAKRAKVYPPRAKESDDGPSKTGGYHGASGGRGGYSRGGGTKNIPTEPRRCYVCKSTEHLAVPFEKDPPKYEESNNSSAVQETTFTYETVLELERLGVVRFVDEKPHCVSPFTVSYKTDRDGKIKKRLCLDLSRCINKCIKEQKVTLSHFQRALELTRAQDYQVTYDLKSAYHHIKIHSAQTKYLGAAVPKPEGGLQYLVFLFMPFGLSSAVHCITKMSKPLNAYIHSKGIRHSIYLDDGRITAASKEQAEAERTVVYGALRSSGWILENKNSDQEGDASQLKDYLGFVINTVSMTVRLGDAKRQQILKQVWETIAHGTKLLPAKELAKTLGKIVATEPALGPVVIMTARAAYSKLDEAVRCRGWHTWLQMDKESIDGLIFFAENCCSFDNAPIRSAATEISVVSIIGPPDNFIKKGFVANHTRTNKENIWASDASGFATCAYSVKGDHLYFRGELSKEERQLSSGHRELLAVKKTLNFYERTNATNAQATNVYWLTDSQNLTTFLTKG